MIICKIVDSLNRTESLYHELRLSLIEDTPPAAARHLFSLCRALAISQLSRYYLDMLRFAWDERKNRGNRIKHGIWFEEARSVFDDPRARPFHDPEHSEGKIDLSSSE
jgi:hypothetical protein